MNTRSVLEYIPGFRKKLFVLRVDAHLLGAPELADILLDTRALHDIGVRLVLVAGDGDSSRFLQQAYVCELPIEAIEAFDAPDAELIGRVHEVIGRGQIAYVHSGSDERFCGTGAELALALHAHKFISLQIGDVPKLKGKPIFAIGAEAIDQVRDCTDWQVLEQAAALCLRGVPRVHILDALTRGVLLDELFSEVGVGSMVHADMYREMRPLQREDIPELLSMIACCVVDAKLVKRNYEEVLSRLDCYYVYTLDETIVGSVALYPYTEENCAELACLFIKPSHEGHGYGRAMCAEIERIAQEQGFARIFALSQSAVSYFRDRLGYEPMERSSLPQGRLKQLESSGRSSGVFGRELLDTTRSS